MSSYEVKDIKIEDETYSIPVRNGVIFQDELESRLKIPFEGKGSIFVSRIEGDGVHIFGEERASWSKRDLIHRVYNPYTGNLQDETKFRGTNYNLKIVSFISALFGGTFLTSAGLFRYGTGMEFNDMSTGLVNYIHALERISALFFMPPILLKLNNLRSSVKERRSKERNYFDGVEEIRESNKTDLKSAIQDINLYQGGIEEVAEQFEQDMEFVDTGNHRSYLQEKSDFDLRLKAGKLGADAIVHFLSIPEVEKVYYISRHGPAGEGIEHVTYSRGTPVRFVNDE